MVSRTLINKKLFPTLFKKLFSGLIRIPAWRPSTQSNTSIVLKAYNVITDVGLEEICPIPWRKAYVVKTLSSSIKETGNFCTKGLFKILCRLFFNKYFFVLLYSVSEMLLIFPHLIYNLFLEILEIDIIHHNNLFLSRMPAKEIEKNLIRSTLVYLKLFNWLGPVLCTCIFSR